MVVIEDAAKKNYFSLFPEELIASVMDAFVINQPMNGNVGGDGFWVHQQDHYLYIVVFDCMGHGHLASMMTRIYTQSLEKTIVDEKVEDPSAILEELHKKIKSKFEGKKNLQIGSGADVGILKINTMVRYIEFAGAKMDLYHIQDGVMDTIKADRLQVGDHFDMEHQYDTKHINLKDAGKANFYLSSDGFKDLFGGPDHKKLGKNNVKVLLEDNAELPMMTQKTNITSYLENWSKNDDALDDMLIVGFSV